MTKIITTVLLGGVVGLSLPEEADCIIEEIRPVLEYMESSNNPKAVGDDGKALGLLQIHKGAVTDVNTVYGLTYDHRDMLNADIAREVYKLYMAIARDQIHNTEGREATEEDYVRSWNGGAYNGWKTKATDKYWKAYEHARSRHYQICIRKCGDTRENEHGICENCGTFILEK